MAAVHRALGVSEMPEQEEGRSAGEANRRRDVSASTGRESLNGSRRTQQIVADTYFKDGRWWTKQPDWVIEDAVNIAWRQFMAKMILAAIRERMGKVVTRWGRRYRYEKYHGQWSAWWFLRHSQWCQDMLDGLDINITGPELLRMIDDGEIELDGAWNLVRAA